MTENGKRPTLQNTKPLDEPGIGRGSLVFFNQASSFQSAHLAYPMVQDCIDAGIDHTFKYKHHLEDGAFPQK
jgi:hypothetical protein